MVLEKVRCSEKYALQLDESTDISGHAQLMANVRFVDGETSVAEVCKCVH